MTDTSMVINILARDRSGGVFKRFGANASLAILGATAAIGKFAKDSITAASDLNETQSKVGVIFGKSAGAVEDYATRAAAALGQSKQQALDAAATFATFGKSAGLSGDKLVGFSTQMTTLASDMASFSNTSPQEAIEAIGAAFRGETEPIRKYGVMLDDATMRQEAVRLGLIKTTKTALTPQQKVLAAQALILKQTTAAQGDFARTSNGLANRQRILAAEFQNVKAEVGQKLLPVVLQLAGALLKLIGFWERNKAVLVPLISVVGTFIATLMAASKAVALINAALRLMGLSSTIALGPVGLIIAAVAALTIGLIIAYKKSETFRAIVIAVFKAVGGFVLGTVSNILRAIGKFIGIAAKIPGPWQGAMKAAAKSINGAADRVDALNRKLQNLPTGKTVRVKVIADLGPFYMGLQQVHAAGFHGRFAKGTSNAPPGLALVGEEGPELVMMRGGEQVIPADRTRAMARSVGSGSAGGGGELRLPGNASGLDRLFLSWLQGVLRANPGVKLVTR